MKKESLKYKITRIAILILTVTVLTAMLVSLAACTDRGIQNDPDQNNGITPNENGEEGTPSDPNDMPNDQPDINDENEIPNTLNGQKAEGTVYHILNSSSADAASTAAPEFMLVTDDGKHYRVRSSEYGKTRDTGNTDNDQDSPTQSPEGNSGTDMTPSQDINGTTEGLGLGDRVRIDITEGRNGETIATVDKCTITVIDKFKGTLMQAKVYTKTGIPSEALTEINTNTAWHHQHFNDYGDFGVFLDRYDLHGFLESMMGEMGNGTVPTLDEEFFKNNSIHIFALPYAGDEVNVGDETSPNQSNDATVYKDGDTLYLMTNHQGYGEYLNSIPEYSTPNGRNMLDKAGDAVRDITDGIGDAAKNITDGILGRNTDADTNTGMNNGDVDINNGNGFSGGTAYKLYIVLLGQEGNDLKTGVVLIDNK